ncbi:MAG TPA: WYL domain-containing protein [Candidatus Hydrogenedentes bacterium]|nr:WYL domain-containing protein [Candidatus Hydrogenedentota bacterium]
MEGHRSAIRLLQLYLLLCDGQKYTLTQLAERCGCSRQTVLRLVEELDKVRGVVIKKWKEGRDRCYQLRSRTSLSVISLDADAIRYLVLCQYIVRHMIPEPVRQNIETRLTAGLEAVSAPDEGKHSFSLAIFKKGYIDYTPFRHVFDDLQQAMDCHTVCRVVYQARLNAPERVFYIAPLKIIASKDAFYLLGQHVNRDGAPEDRPPMTLAVHRIRNLTRLDVRFSTELEKRTETVPLSQFGFRFDEPFRARIRFSPEAATYAYERRWSEDEEKRLLEDGSLELSFTAASRPEVRAFVYGFGSQAELLEPVDLREEMRGELERAARLYADGAG